jgi:3-hydroxybutyryl-CoA dehydrogenase
MNTKRTYHVLEMTRVYIPTPDFPTTPYYVYLMEGPDGKKRIWNSTRRYAYHDRVYLSGETKGISYHIGIIGAGTTGTGIAVTCLLRGCSITLFVRNSGKKERIKEAIRQHVPDGTQERLIITDSWSDFRHADFIIEAVDEDLKTKQTVYRLLEPHIARTTAVATNTSSLSIDTLASAFLHPSRFLGMHFFNPVPKMTLVEIVKGKKTHTRVVVFAKQIARMIGKEPVLLTNAHGGFIVNRLLFAFLSEAIKLHSERVASHEDIDRAIELGLRHPMGPFKLMDTIGIDVSYEIVRNLSSLYRKSANLRLLRTLIREKRMGRKSGSGFYKYTRSRHGIHTTDR